MFHPSGVVEMGTDYKTAASNSRRLRRCPERRLKGKTGVACSRAHAVRAVLFSANSEPAPDFDPGLSAVNGFLPSPHATEPAASPFCLR